MTKDYNTTQLYIDRAAERGIVHRDYLAHCLRWTHVLKHAKTGQAILDVGCGINTPLAWTFYTNKYKPRKYVGLDYRDNFEVVPKTFNFPMALVGGFDVTKEIHWDGLAVTHGNNFDIVTCFEVLEHMEKENGIRLLTNLSINAGNGLVFLSTPVFNGSAAANHIHEWEYLELKDELEKYFTIQAVHGTFASQADILPVLTPGELEVFQRLKMYYDSNLISILLAPAHPEQSRNCIWRLRAR
jgi:hypothetical protein